MECRLTRLLQRWGDWHHADRLHGPYPGVNLLYRIARTGIPDAFQPGHRILCREMPKSLSAIERAWKRLDSDASRQVIYVKFVFDRDENGKTMTDFDRAKLLDCNVLDFKAAYLKARRELRYRLSEFA